MSAQLFVVAIPIGHLDDMTFRAIDILKSVSVVAAERYTPISSIIQTL